MEFEGTGRVWLGGLTIHAHPDAIYREFQGGLVLANPALAPYAFDLGRLLPGGRFKKIQGTRGQDQKTNDGSLAGERVVLGARDGLFLARE